MKSHLIKIFSFFIFLLFFINILLTNNSVNASSIDYLADYEGTVLLQAIYNKTFGGGIFLGVTPTPNPYCYITDLKVDTGIRAYQLFNLNYGNVYFNFTYSSGFLTEWKTSFFAQFGTAGDICYLNFYNITGGTILIRFKISCMAYDTYRVSYYDATEGWKILITENDNHWTTLGFVYHNIDNVTYQCNDEFKNDAPASISSVPKIKYMSVVYISTPSGNKIFVDNTNFTLSTTFPNATVNASGEQSFIIGVIDADTGFRFRHYGLDIPSWKNSTLWGYIESDLFSDMPMYSHISGIHFEYDFVEGSTHMFHISGAYRKEWNGNGWTNIYYKETWANFTLYSSQGYIMYVSRFGVFGGNENDTLLGDINGNRTIYFKFYDENDNYFSHLGYKGSFFDSTPFNTDTLCGTAVKYGFEGTGAFHPTNIIYSSEMSTNSGLFAYRDNFTDGDYGFFYFIGLYTYNNEGEVKSFKDASLEIPMLNGAIYYIHLELSPEIAAEYQDSLTIYINNLPILIKLIIGIFITLIITILPLLFSFLLSKGRIEIDIPSLLYVGFFFLGLCVSVILGFLPLETIFIILFGLVIALGIIWYKKNSGGE